MIGTPFHTRTHPLTESMAWRNWAGYASASQYELTHDREYYAIRNAAGLIDVSPLYKYLIEGSDAIKLVDRLITRDVTKCRIGQVLYTTWCDEQGMVIDDGTVSRLADNKFRITAADPNLRWFQDNAFKLDVSIRDISEEMAALALQGPNSRAILQELVSERDELTTLRFFRVMRGTINGRSLDISRTGFTGDLGYELWMAQEDAPAIWDALMDVGQDYGLVPTGMVALDMARIEAGLLLIDVDYTPSRKAKIAAQKSSPFELGLGWTVDEGSNGRYIGQRAHQQEKQTGSRWATAGIEIDWSSLQEAYRKVGLAPEVPHTSWRSSIPLFARGRGSQKQIGYATSGTFSPILKRYIAIASIEPRFAALGTDIAIQLNIEHSPRLIRARVVEMPFYNPTHKKG